MGMIDRLVGTGRTTLGMSLLGFALAPFTGSFLYGWVVVACIFANGGAAQGSSGEILLMGSVFAFFAAVVGAMIAYPAMLIVGVPSWLLLRYARAEGAVPYALCGALGGSLMPPLKRGWSFFGEPPQLHTAIAGALVMLCFWGIAGKRGRPDYSDQAAW
ncbi:MAG TPA: hypothetical protein VF727_11610 [Allosphingosinicella sp.]|jgi:membrane protease YdiL (CAAX protease family)